VRNKKRVGTTHQGGRETTHLDNRSTSVKTTILKLRAPTDPDCNVPCDAISLMTSWITNRSLLPASDGLHSMWKLDPNVVISTARFDVVLNVRCSNFTFSTPAP